jgi:hypothetical protein
MYTVELGCPAPAAVLAVHLGRLGVTLSRAVPDLPVGTRPTEVVAWAERIAEDRTAEPPPSSLDTVFLRIVDPDGSESPPLSLRDRNEVRVGRPYDGVVPDIPADGDLVHRDHCRLTRDRQTSQWWLDPRGPNRPSLRRRGATEPEPVGGLTRLRHGDVILIHVRPKEVGKPRHWWLEFNDPQHTNTARNGREISR